MKCELIVDGITKEEFLRFATLSTECKTFHDGKVHAIYESKKHARDDKMSIKNNYPCAHSEISTRFNGWCFTSV